MLRWSRNQQVAHGDDSPFCHQSSRGWGGRGRTAAPALGGFEQCGGTGPSSSRGPNPIYVSCRYRSPIAHRKARSPGHREARTWKWNASIVLSSASAHRVSPFVLRGCSAATNDCTLCLCHSQSVVRPYVVEQPARGCWPAAPSPLSIQALGQS